MEKTALLGLQWGDEGKGKVIDVIANNYQVVARFQGGNNAGHTVVIGDCTYKLNQIPSGILRPEVIAFLGSGVVIELQALFEEIEQLRSKDIVITGDNLKIADNATLLLPLYQLVDQLLEKMKGGDKIGTTGKGIGIAYQDRVARRALCIGDIFEKEVILRKKIAQITAFYAPLLAAHDQDIPQDEAIYQFIISYKERVFPHLIHPYLFFNDDELKTQRVLFEGAQGLMLDINWGTYPFVTSSNTHTAQLFLGTGIDFGEINKIIGVLKAYTTRVGEGPFFTEDKGELGALLQERGQELGTVTGRKRRCGALDLVAARYAVRLSGVTEIALTKLDVLDTLDMIPLCIAYELNGKQIHHPPTTQSDQYAIKPIYTYLQGWKKEIRNIRKYNQLPEEALAYIEFIETFLRVPIKLISVGPDRIHNIVKIHKI